MNGRSSPPFRGTYVTPELGGGSIVHCLSRSLARSPFPSVRPSIHPSTATAAAVVAAEDLKVLLDSLMCSPTIDVTSPAISWEQEAC